MSASEPTTPGDADWSPPSTSPSAGPISSTWTPGSVDSAVPTYPGARVGGTTVVPPSVAADLGYAFEIGRSGAAPSVEPESGPAIDFDFDSSMLGSAVGPPPGDGSTDGEPAAAPPLPPAAMPPTTAAATTAAAPTVTHGRQRHRRIGPVLVGVLVPGLMILLGLSLMASSFAGGGSDSSSASDRVSRPRNEARPASAGGSSNADDNSDSESTTGGSSSDSAADGTASTEPVVITAAVPVIAVPVVGDPADRAAVIAQTYLTALANEDFRTARAMTDSDVDERAEQNLDAAAFVPVSASQVGPDRVAMRLVIVEYRTIENELTTTFVCARWDIATATGRIDQLGRVQLGDRRVGKVVPGDLGDTLAADCDATPITFPE